jgi:D-alanine-D-alanine ligase
MKKINLCIIFGGKSAEHEVSLQSANSIINAVDRDKYHLTLIAMDKTGRFFLCDENNFLSNANNSKIISLKKLDNELAFIPGESKASFYSIRDKELIDGIDVVFPIIHGPYGEDGSLQGLLKLLNVPFVGSGVSGSAVGMDKDIMKRLLRDSGIKISNFLVYRSSGEADYEKAVEKLGLPLFIKPANLGSSVGVSKVTNKETFINGVKNAFKFDRKIIIEEFIEGREIECAVKGNSSVEVSIPGEILPTDEFYSYEAKYINETGALLKIPADIDEDLINQIKEIGENTYHCLDAKGLARIDFFVKGREILVNEINTLPGFTKISMYPKLWKYEGVQYKALINELIDLAIEEHEENEILLNKM